MWDRWRHENWIVEAEDNVQTDVTVCLQGKNQVQPIKPKVNIKSPNIQLRPVVPVSDPI